MARRDASSVIRSASGSGTVYWAPRAAPYCVDKCYGVRRDYVHVRPVYCT